MRKTLGLFLALALALSGTIAVFSPAEAATKCSEKLMWDQIHLNDGSTGDDEWWITFTIYYAFCKPDYGNSYVRVKRAHLLYNQEGTKMDCDTTTGFNVLRWVKADPYYWDGGGRNYNPGNFKAFCQTDTTGSAEQIYPFPNTPKLFWDTKGSPKWKANIKVEKEGIFFDAEGTARGRFTAKGMLAP